MAAADSGTPIRVRPNALHARILRPECCNDNGIADQGPEFTARALDQWAYRNGITLKLIQPGRPMQDGYVESFNGKFRDECLNEHWFPT